MSKEAKFEIKKLSDREHIVHRPSMYIGSVSNEQHETAIFENVFEEPKLQTKQLTYAPGLIKIINEVIDNSVDVIIKTGKGSTIKVKLSEDKVEVQDDSTGFPMPEKFKKLARDGGVAKREVFEDLPVVIALGNARAGSNFNDEDNLGQMGTNGVGAFATNCFSKRFVCVTKTQDTTTKVEWRDNALLHSCNIDYKKSEPGTSITFWPDLAKFSLAEISEDVKDVIRTRLVVLSLTYPDIKFYFDGKRIKTPKRISNLFTTEETPFVEHSTDNYQVLVIANSEKTSHFSVVNGLNTPDGGSHIDLILQEIVKELSETKGLNCTRADVLNTLQIVFIGRGWKNLRFNSQTKEKITNSTKETREYLGNLDALVQKVKKSKQIKDFIKATTQARELRVEKKAIKDAKKTKIKSDKFLDAQGDREILMLVEGDSAMGGLVPALGRKGIAYYALKGKPLNAYKSSAQKVAANKELSELLAIIHQNDFKKITIASDSDGDGAHITGLLLGFVCKFLPEYKDKVYKLQTPVKGAMKDGKLVRWAFNLEESVDIKSGESLMYFKGLGTLDPSDIDAVVKQVGMGGILSKMDLNVEGFEEAMEAWLGDDADTRKRLILANNFSIASI
nr:MAG TPA: DNA TOPOISOMERASE IV, B SUBUNIT [Caudoviricetes sp.]